MGVTHGRTGNVNVNVNVFSHLLSAAYKMTSGPLHVSLGIHAEHSKPMIDNRLLASKIRGMQRGIRKS